MIIFTAFMFIFENLFKILFEFTCNLLFFKSFFFFFINWLLYIKDSLPVHICLLMGIWMGCKNFSDVKRGKHFPPPFLDFPTSVKIKNGWIWKIEFEIFYSWKAILYFCICHVKKWIKNKIKTFLIDFILCRSNSY